MPKVINIHKDKASQRLPNYRYIGRGSPYGNPYRIGPDGDRAAVITKFKANVLPGLDVSALKGCVLGCYCAPLACHGDAIFEKANS